MGADEKAETKSKTLEVLDYVFAPTVLEKLDNGWVVREDQSSGQLVLLPPPTYGDAA